MEAKILVVDDRPVDDGLSETEALHIAHFVCTAAQSWHAEIISDDAGKFSVIFVDEPDDDLMLVFFRAAGLAKLGVLSDDVFEVIAVARHAEVLLHTAAAVMQMSYAPRQ